MKTLHERLQAARAEQHIDELEAEFLRVANQDPITKCFIGIFEVFRGRKPDAIELSQLLNPPLPAHLNEHQ